MVRTKPSRIGNTKRNRTSFQEEKLSAKLKEFDILADCELASLESKFTDEIEELFRMIKTIKNRMPKHALQMRMGDLRLLGVKSFADLENLAMEPCESMSVLDPDDFSRISDKTSKDKPVKHSKSDDGYQTEDSAISSIPSSFTTNRMCGPLSSAIKNRRRSKSVSSHATPSKGHSSLLIGIKSKKTFGGSQTFFANDSRLSRQKFRTPGANNRLQTVSTDRGMSLITPKVQPNTPLAIMRHARIGESIYSVTGSPVITTATMEQMANVNIPVANGILSIRPTEMDTFDPGLVQKIDSDTLEHLKKLQMNLNKIMQIAEEHNFQQS
ncbi:borealin-like [Wyeomyia smithii]|uniref:borealin-like n=1 Tax=Wyeomyia smithii TaxID=174621 RepID=UPI002467C900|nr:borealin-like [Wyeomyia smithii]XP_055536767.1 borealin-like [Wyeomyia smithii]XP_055536768.1 borealin-like [Wyeomyia smithii]